MKKIISYLLYAFASLLALATLLSLFYNLRFWWLKVLDFPRLQFFFLGLFLLPLLLFFACRSSVWFKSSVAFVVVSLFIQAYHIYPYTPLGSKSIADAKGKSPTVSLLISNVYMENRQYEKLIALVRQKDPDILILLETDTAWQKQTAPLRKHYAYQEEYPLNNTYGMLVYSKHPLENTEWLFLNQENVPSLRALVKPDNQVPFLLYAIHPVPPIPDEYPDNVGEREVALVKIGKQLKNINSPVVVAGDFNDVSWSKTNRLFEQEGLMNNVRLGRGLFNTFNAKSAILRWPLDHVFVSDQFTVQSLSRENEIGSDHFPFFVELVLKQ